MIIETFVLTAFQQNTRVVVCEKTSRAICIDPGEASPEIVGFIKENNYTLQAVTLTHGHLDHAGGTLYLKEQFPDADVIVHPDEEELYYGLPEQPAFLGIPKAAQASLGMDYAAPPKATRHWQDGETYELGELRFKILHCPGHTRGHVVLAEENERKVFVGDCLFRGSIGRTDLPGGSYEQLMDSITNKILPLGDDVEVYSGHGEVTTIGHEKAHNPFLTGVYQIGKGRFL
ncbi:MAG TPA: MBL fold metallo-hydrolase [Pyrinomonadaceae bacterium]|jgi:hydroxyacylglutathione hydrolase|nr:MBL fold metallo-hydrolase [Pyrinomonadaceae bacterium]